jgi:hypothetical protein
MRLTRLIYVPATCILATAQLTARANNVPKADTTPPQAETTVVQGGTFTIVPGPAQGQVQAQGQGQIVVTATAQAVPGGGRGAPNWITVDANGAKHVQSEEYGKKITITDDPQKGIKIQYTVKKGGTDEIKTYQAKDVAELEKKSPEAFKLYQQFLGNQAGGPGPVIIQAQGNLVPAVPGGPVPFPMPGGQGGIQIMPALPAQPVPGAGGGLMIQGQAQLAGSLPIEAATEALGQLRKDIKSAAASDAWKDASLESRIALKKQAAAMRKQLQELENQLQSK